RASSSPRSKTNLSLGRSHLSPSTKQAISLTQQLNIASIFDTRHEAVSPAQSICEAGACPSSKATRHWSLRRGCLARHSERWRIHDLCLKFIIPLQRSTRRAILSICSLSRSAPRQITFAFVRNHALGFTGIEGFEHKLPSEEPHLFLTIVRVL
ncbi:hypothetical protein EV363DRAFT_1168886, partial [Boletus edulis]